jgi:hypothetical protein
MWKALKHVLDNSTARDLLKRLLQPDPKKRIALMRQVLEHFLLFQGKP